MKRAPYLLTLHAGDATREIAYQHDARGDVHRVDESGWDAPVECVIDRAVLELRQEGRPPVIVEISGSQYLRLEEGGAVEGLIGALARGRKPADALQYAMVAAVL